MDKLVTWRKKLQYYYHKLVLAYVHVSIFVIIIYRRQVESHTLHPTEGMRILHGRITLDIMIQFIIWVTCALRVHVHAHGTLIWTQKGSVENCERKVMVKSSVKKFPSTNLPPESLMDKINLYSQNTCQGNSSITTAFLPLFVHMNRNIYSSFAALLRQVV